MFEVILAIIILTALGLVFGLILAFASAVMAVPVDEKVEALRSALPGANCGACGYSGCDGYAEAMARGEAQPGLCTPGGQDVAEITASILGVESAGVQEKKAQVKCGGCDQYINTKLEYRGIATCAAANQFYGGEPSCSYGCLGYGDCAAACEYGAITVENGLAIINKDLCVGCTKCVSVCPKSIIEMVPGSAKGIVRCSSHDKGAVVRKACSVGCIGCMKCTKVCEYDAIHVSNFLAKIDPEKCVGCGACADSCPTGCINIFGYQPKKQKAAV
ncbi:MAG TPA: RnfABCDGE type electron transport complex subunit B [Clostridiales bacterium]|nr:RnfABCDGE type electron transport complex subunit B [Clostridiales bacterium]